MDEDMEVLERVYTFLYVNCLVPIDTEILKDFKKSIENLKEYKDYAEELERFAESYM